MTDSAPQATIPDAIDAKVVYSVDTGVKPVNETMEAGNLTRIYKGEFVSHVMRIENGRPLADRLALDTNGFVFCTHETKMRDFFDGDELKSVYYPEIEALIKRVSGAARVVIFDHTLRSSDQATREEKLIREPVHRAHNDYTDWSGPQRVRDVMGKAEAEKLLRHRVAIIQVWRPIRHPVERDPLAICDARTMVEADLIASERRYPDRVGETYQIAHNPDHRWFYFPRMERHEALVFKVYESRTDVARYTAHTGFEDPTSPTDAIPRESIEMRALAFFDD